ncbi:MAG: hypothetical protein ACWA5L_10575 [bacterium]
MALKIYDTVTRTLGFAVRNYELTARLAWLPLLLSALLGIAAPFILLSISQNRLIGPDDVSNFKAALYTTQVLGDLASHHFPALIITLLLIYFLFIVFQTSALIPLLRYAAYNERPAFHSFPISFGWAHLKYAVTSLITIAGISLISFVPWMVSSNFIASAIEAASNRGYAVFPDSNSLHRIEIMSGGDSAAMGILELLSKSITIGLIILGIYVGVRLFAFPAFAALKQRGMSWSALASSWNGTRGFNFLRILAILFILSALLLLVTLLLNMVVLPLLLATLNSGYFFAEGWLGVARAEGDSSSVLPLFSWLWTVFVLLLNMFYQFLIIGITAGLGGRLYHQMVRED